MQSFMFVKEKDGTKNMKSISYFNGTSYFEILEDFEDWSEMQKDVDDLYILPCDDTGKVYDWSRMFIKGRKNNKDSWTIFKINPLKHKKGTSENAEK